MKNRSSWCENGVCEIQMNCFSVTNAGVVSLIPLTVSGFQDQHNAKLLLAR